MLTVSSPTVCRIPSAYADKLKPHLSYIDKKIDHEIARVKRNAAYISPNNSEKIEAYHDLLTQLKSERKKSLLLEDEEGYYTYSGLAHILAPKVQTEIINQVEYPECEMNGWAVKPEYEPRDYQVAATEKLIEAKHAAVSIGTGLGKTTIIEMLIKHYGLKAVVTAPSVSIAEQLFRQLSLHFSKKRVGQFFNGKKDCTKLITVAVSASLARVEKDSDEWKQFAQVKLFIVDESHMTPAETLKSICMELVANAPYRFFMSGTQIRTDGQGLVLQGVTGPIVYDMPVQQGVDQGWLAKPLFRVVPIISKVDYYSQIVDKMTNKHLRYNPQVLTKAALIANKSVSVQKRHTVILIDEIEQFSRLLPLLNHQAEFAHGTLSADGKKTVPQKYWKSNPHEQVDRFNNGEIPILVGTSCISTGTDLKIPGSIIYLVGGMSEIAVKQAVGRSTRGGLRSNVIKPEGATMWGWEDKKTDCYYWDFNVKTQQDVQGGRQTSVSRHSEERIAIYKDIYPGSYLEVAL